MTELEPPKQVDQKNAEGNYQDIVLTLNTVARSLKVLEEKVTNMRNKVQLTDQNVLAITKKTNDETKLVNGEIMDIKRDVADLREKMQLIVKELKESARSEEVKVLERYIQLWDPIQFATRTEVEKMIKEAFMQKARETKQE